MLYVYSRFGLVFYECQPFQKHKIPTLTVQLTRELEWRSLYPELKGPDMCVLHFGPNHDMGRFGYGILGEEYMSKYLRRSGQGSS